MTRPLLPVVAAACLPALFVLVDGDGSRALLVVEEAARFREWQASLEVVPAIGRRDEQLRLAKQTGFVLGQGRALKKPYFPPRVMRPR